MQRNLRKVARFYLFRRTYSWMEGCRQAVVGSTPRSRSAEVSALLSSLQTDNAIDELRSHGVATGIQLPEPSIEAIQRFALSTRCTSPDRQYTGFIHDLPSSGLLVPRLYVCNPMDCESVRQIVDDANLNEVVREYLGYVPNHAEPTLTWSLASGRTHQTDDQRTGYDASVFHYDTEGFNSVQAIFFITDVSRDSGTHVVIRNSHRNKPLSMTLRSSLRTGQQQLIKEFGARAELFIEGQRGTGFLEDPACFHRVIHPTRSDRLALRVIYS